MFKNSQPTSAYKTKSICMFFRENLGQFLPFFFSFCCETYLVKLVETLAGHNTDKKVNIVQSGKFTSILLPLNEFLVLTRDF